MKKYLVCSDIHGRVDRFKAALDNESSIDGVIIAGDLQCDTYEITDTVNARFPSGCRIFMVAGNCDAYTPSASLLVSKDTVPLSQKHKAFLTHGHRYGNASYDLMSYAASECGCDVVIYGHTHSCDDTLFAGIRFINPGAMRTGSYAVITIAEDDVLRLEFKYA